jgi:Putative GTPase activating protein for Arf
MTISKGVNMDHDESNDSQGHRLNTYVAPTLIGYSTDSSLWIPPASRDISDHICDVATSKNSTTGNNRSNNVNVSIYDHNNDDLQMDPKIFHEIQQISGNKFCIDCHAKEPDWGSPSFGILFCFNCSGKHRYVFISLYFLVNAS